MTSPLIRRPGAGALPSYYLGYLDHVPETDQILDTLLQQGRETAALFGAVPAERETYRYAEGKWSVRELLGHLVDTERVFQLRALWFARGDAQELPGFDENRWASASNADTVPLGDLIAEHEAVRRASVLLFRNLDAQALVRTGTANGRDFQVGALPWFLVGHERHHLAILRSRYGVGA